MIIVKIPGLLDSGRERSSIPDGFSSSHSGVISTFQKPRSVYPVAVGKAWQWQLCQNKQDAISDHLFTVKHNAMLLQDRDRSKLDSNDDAIFYEIPRFVTHIDENFIQQLSDLYRERLQPNSRILDMMSSWVSHLPEEMTFDRVEGQGMNEAELSQNPQLDAYFVQNLNHDPKFPHPDNHFDAVLNAVSVQYLQEREQSSRLLSVGRTR